MSHFNDNLKVLEKKNPALAEFLQGIQIPDSFSIVKARNGLPTVRFDSETGRSHWLHSDADPLAEARRQLDGLSFKNPDATVLFGFGLGYLAREIAARKEPEHVLCIAERFPALLKLAMEQTDLTLLLSSTNVYFFLEQSATRMLDGFKPLQLKAVSGDIHKLMAPAFLLLYDDYYAEIEKKLNEHVSSLRFDFRHFTFFQYELLGHVLENIPAMLGAVALDELKGILQGQPVLVIAAGPSLDEHLERLRTCADDYFIICADAALKPLLKYRITPDLVATCDPTALNIRKIDSISAESLTSLPLLFRADAQPLLIEHFTGPNLLVDGDSSLSHWLVNRGRRVIGFDKYQNVAHLAFQAARFMGADPIILIGLDFSFPKEQAHASDCTSPWGLDQCKGLLRFYPGTDGAPVKTLDSFISYIHRLEQDIESTRARCLNCSEHGARIRGTRAVPLDRVLVIETTDARFKTIFKNRLAGSFSRSSLELKKHYRESLEWLLDQSRSARGLCQEAEKHLVQTEPSPDPSETLTALRTLQQKMFAQKPFLDIVSDYLSGYLLSFYRIPDKGLPAV
ncbi:MAG: DUF115 domain-containing protein, partial [Desulfobacteraceae bacterium]